MQTYEYADDFIVVTDNIQQLFDILVICLFIHGSVNTLYQLVMTIEFYKTYIWLQ